MLRCWCVKCSRICLNDSKNVLPLTLLIDAVPSYVLCNVILRHLRSRQLLTVHDLKNYRQCVFVLDSSVDSEPACRSMCGGLESDKKQTFVLYLCAQKIRIYAFSDRGRSFFLKSE